jgi:hypothetical protein
MSKRFDRTAWQREYSIVSLYETSKPFASNNAAAFCFGGVIMAAKERYIVNERGERVAVVLDTADYEALLDELAELRERDEMRQYDPTRDPDAGLELKASLVEELLKQEQAYKAGRLQGKPLEQVARELGLDDDV